MIFPARRILVPDDLTPASRRAWAWARRVAAPGARLESLFLFDLPAAPMEGLPEPALSAGARQNLLARLRRERPDASAWRGDEGDAVSGILRRARRADRAA